MNVPKNSLLLMRKAYKSIYPAVKTEWSKWKGMAERIPDPELRQQALDVYEKKYFHCEAGGIISMLAGEKSVDAIAFIVPYQLICDYLDNLCDQTRSFNPDDFAALHEALHDCFFPGEAKSDYYRFRETKDDGGYLNALVDGCRRIVANTPSFSAAKPHVLDLSRYYSELQIHKHVREEEREERLIRWFESYKADLPDMTWYEFSACTGSTVGVYCLMSCAMGSAFTPTYAKMVRDCYFPYGQGIHILLDYFIDQEEDQEDGELNFCTYYENESVMMDRFLHFLQQAKKGTESLPHAKFHSFLIEGIVAVYLSEEKATEKKSVQNQCRKLVHTAGFSSVFFYWNGRTYKTIRKMYKAE
ncbi:MULTISPECIES: tetraprenyl-beta-curcumene synthase family protein [Bacillaceae]|uniref:Tetraprenyl-beta-curcumene synthase n=1 Tax=Domibacillus aminovorans TaxID=29332 RepID=A0A177KSF6_9BACI|nr:MULTISPECIES: tetraprenyl-beta-curcumene synthase family protein [Bacillaceae]OAH56268.1 tetraprenyl-beta-curcumene synthase [Domibacillus aminovorans]